jgi:hypothetical protein
MSKKESSVCIMRVGRRLAVLVMDPVISGPHKDGVLHSNAVDDHEKETEW